VFLGRKEGCRGNHSPGCLEREDTSRPAGEKKKGKKPSFWGTAHLTTDVILLGDGTWMPQSSDEWKKMVLEREPLVSSHEVSSSLEAERLRRETQENSTPLKATLLKKNGREGG